MRGIPHAYDKIHSRANGITGGCALPSGGNDKLQKANTKKSLFRGMATVIKAYNGTSRIFAKDCSDIAAWVPEGGSIPLQDGAIVDFCFDNGGDPEQVIPDVEMLNRKIAEWQRGGVSFASIVHSHNNYCRLLSGADIDYARTILKNCGMSSVLFPVVTYCGEDIILTPYIITPERVDAAHLLVIGY